jgi:hypothetical protein
MLSSAYKWPHEVSPMTGQNSVALVHADLHEDAHARRKRVRHERIHDFP